MMSDGSDTGLENRGQRESWGSTPPSGATSDRAHFTSQPDIGVAESNGFVSASPVFLSESKRNASIRLKGNDYAQEVEWYTRQSQELVPFTPGMRVRVSPCAPYALLAQLVEQRTFNPQAEGSRPSERTICIFSSAGRAADS